MYVFGSAGSSSTFDANRNALRKWKIIPRMLVDCSKRDLTVIDFFL
jgi:isopentenyl diphosphate isomerase/L-lactate dehydrogenase-like FMN-dependent dehydrogenase